MSDGNRDDRSASRDIDDVIGSRTTPSRFGEVFERHVVAIFRYLARRVGDEEAENLASATFADAFRNRHRYDPVLATPRAWLFGIATTHVLHHRRSEARRLDAHRRIPPSASPESATELFDRRRDDRARLDAALSLIGPELRDIVMLIAVAELTYQECAAALEIPIGTVRSRLAHARRELRGLLEDPPLVDDPRRLAREGNLP